MTEENSKPAGAAERKGPTTCLTILLYGLLAILLIGVSAVVINRSYVQKKAYDGMSPAQIAEFEQWMSESPDFLPEMQTLSTPMPVELAKAKEDYFTKLRPVIEALDNTFQGPLSDIINNVIVHGKPIDTKYLDFALTTTQHLKPLFDEGASLALHPEYKLNSQQTPSHEVDSSGMRLLYWYTFVYAQANARTGNTTAALESIETSFELIQHDLQSDSFAYTTEHMVYRRTNEFSAIIANESTSSIELRLVLDMLNKNVPPPQADDADYSYLGEDVMILNQMEADGYKTVFEPTRADLTGAEIHLYEFYKWLEKRLSTNDRRYAVLHEKMVKHRAWVSKSNKSLLLDRLSIGPLKLLVHEVSYERILQAHINMWKSWLKTQVRARSAIAHFHLVRLAIARRIASLEGKPVPVSADEFVPQYLPAFPQDPFTTGPLRYSAKRAAHYSVGPDGLDNTSDDIAIVSSTDEGTTEVIDLNKLAIQ